MRALACTFLFIALAAQVSADTWDVGFRRISIVDHSRPGVDTEWRAIEAFLWYPADAPGVALTRKAYFPSSDVAARDALRKALEAMLDESPEDANLDAILSETLPVTADAPPANGPFPIVLVSAGLGSSPGKLSSICERLAAAGYLVVAVPTPPLAGWRLRFDQAALETIMRDLEVTLGMIGERDDADRSRAALVGWSIGSVAQTLLQMRNPLVDALVSLDGGIGYDYGSALAKESPWFRDSELQAPLLDVRAMATVGVPRAWDVLDLPRSGPVWRLECKRLIHADMTTDFGELSARATGSDNENRDTIEFMKEVVVAFLDATMKGKDAAIVALQEKAPDGVVLRRAD